MPTARLRMISRNVCVTFFLAISAAAAPAAPPPAEAFAAFPETSDLALSPNGNLLAWADRSGAEPMAVVFDVAAAQTRRKIAVGKEYKLRGLNWSDDETLLIDLSQTDKDETAGGKSYEIWRTLAIDMATGKGHVLLVTSGADLLAWHTGRPKKVVMSSFAWTENAEHSEMDTRLAGHREDSGWVAGLFEVDTDSGRGVRIEQGTNFTVGWIVDRTGHCLARSEWNPKRPEYRVLAKDGAGWREIYSRKDRGDFELDGPTADGTGIIAVGPNADGRRVVWTLPLDGSGLKVLYADATADVEYVEFDRFDGTPVGVMLGGQEQAYHFFDKKAQSRFESLARAFKDRRIEDYGRSEDGKRVIARVESPSHPAIYYLVDYNKHTADIVGDEYPALADTALGEVSAITYKARDGTTIPAFLTLPPGVAGKSLPLVVMPHGGPESNDVLKFDWWVQFLATHGYAVLQPQFRGSTGYGDAFRRAGYHQWGMLMQDDVTDGVKAMIEQGIADAKRVCIVGWSYGGYAALAGAAFTPDLYKCAVSIAGVSDLPAMLGWETGYKGKESDSNAYWKESIGTINDKSVIDHSPARAAARVRVPVLLIHGVDDTTVPISQSEAMARELGKLKKPVTFIKLPGVDHQILLDASRLQVLKEIEKFLAANL